MIDVRVYFVSFVKEVAKQIERSSFKNLGHAAASLRKSVIASIIPSKVASAPGTPPHTRRGRLQVATVYQVEGLSAVIGPRWSMVKGAGAAHEYGGEYLDRYLPQRPFMLPGLDRAIPRFAGEFKGMMG